MLSPLEHKDLFYEVTSCYSPRFGQDIILEVVLIPMDSSDEENDEKEKIQQVKSGTSSEIINHSKNEHSSKNVVKKVRISMTKESLKSFLSNQVVNQEEVKETFIDTEKNDLMLRDIWVKIIEKRSGRSWVSVIKPIEKKNGCHSYVQREYVDLMTAIKQDEILKEVNIKEENLTKRIKFIVRLWELREVKKCFMEYVELLSEDAKFSYLTIFFLNTENIGKEIKFKGNKFSWKPARSKILQYLLETQEKLYGKITKDFGLKEKEFAEFKDCGNLDMKKIVSNWISLERDGEFDVTKSNKVVCEKVCCGKKLDEYSRFVDVSIYDE